MDIINDLKCRDFGKEKLEECGIIKAHMGFCLMQGSRKVFVRIFSCFDGWNWLEYRNVEGKERKG